MIAADKDALVCDLAEVYHITDMRALPVETLAALSFGLPPGSRSMRRLTGREGPDEKTLLLAIIADRLGFLCWAKTEDGRNGVNRPASIYELLTGGTERSGNVESYAGGAEFTAAWRKMTGEEA